MGKRENGQEWKWAKGKISKRENRPKGKCEKGTTGKRGKKDKKGIQNKYIKVFVHLRDLFFFSEE